MRMTLRLSALLCLGTAAALAVGGCAKRGPRDVGNQNPRSEFADGSGAASPQARDASAPAAERVLARPSVVGRRPVELAKASARAIVTSATHVYFGNAEDDTIYRLAKAGSEPTRIARRAPMPNALAIDTSGDDPLLVWIGSPGDVILRVAVMSGGMPTPLVGGALFANIATTNGNIFFTEIHGAGGVVARMTGGSATRIATFDGSPRGIAVDDQHVFIATTTHLLTTPRTRADLSQLASGAAFASPHVDADWLYATAANPKGKGRVLVRVKKTAPGDGALETIATNVSDAPIALHEGTVYWFDARRPALLAADTNGAQASTFVTRTISEDPMLDHVYGIAIDDDGAFLASGYGDAGRILNVLLR